MLSSLLSLYRGNDYAKYEKILVELLEVEQELYDPNSNESVERLNQLVKMQNSAQEYFAQTH